MYLTACRPASYERWSWFPGPGTACRVAAAALLIPLLTASTALAQQQFRAFWADVWGVGFMSTTEINDMVNRAVQGHYNVIIPEVLAYHDSNGSSAHGAFWKSGIVPWAPAVTESFDPLAYLCQQAHAQNIQVHPWLVPYRVGGTWPPPGNSLLGNHGEYFMVPQGSMNGGPVAFGSPVAAFYLDPGSPDVQEYLLSIVRELVTNYPIDGIHFDYIRYVQTNAGYPAWSSYTNSSLERFRRIAGRTDTPPFEGDTAWNDFRRRGITELVRRCRAEIPTLANPRQPVRLSAAVVTWGNAPATFQGSSSWTLFQNWEEWQRIGFLDTTIPMTYYSDSSYPTWYRNWVDKEMTWRYSRHMVVGPGIYLNTFAQSLSQMQYALNHGADGLCTYSYSSTRSDSGSDWDWYPYIATNLFTAVVSPPTMPWRSPATATEGTIWGRVTDPLGLPVDDASVQVGSLSAVKTDGNGYYVVTMLPAAPGGTNYTVGVTKPGLPSGMILAAQVLPGVVVRYDFALVSGVPGDFDGDDDVDQEDFGVFQKCLTGPDAGPPAPGCSLADIDPDNDVDAVDLGKFKQCRTGPEIPGSLTCAD